MALKHVHKLRIVHRDVKGSNMFITGAAWLRIRWHGTAVMICECGDVVMDSQSIPMVWDFQVVWIPAFLVLHDCRPKSWMPYFDYVRCYMMLCILGVFHFWMLLGDAWVSYRFTDEARNIVLGDFGVSKQLSESQQKAMTSAAWCNWRGSSWVIFWGYVWICIYIYNLI